MPSLTVPGAELYYETHGKGPILILIAGAGGSGVVFLKTAETLKETFTVVTYDRRGHSKSYLTGEQDYSHRLERDADDVAELIKHVSSSQSPTHGPSAYVLGSSSGAVVACTLLHRHPSLIQKVICHEPPLLKSLPDSEKQIGIVNGVYDTYRAKGPVAALMGFAQTHMAKEDTAAMFARSDSHADPYTFGNLLYWFERELTVYASIDVPWAELEKPEVKKSLIMGVSEGGAGAPAGRAAVLLAEKLELGPAGLVRFPGAHLGYITQPEKFAICLKGAVSF